MYRQQWIAVGMLMSLTLGSNMMDSLSSRGFVPQANLFVRGLMWEDQNTVQNSLRDIFLRRDYGRFRKEVIQQYPQLEVAPLKTRYDYAIACYVQQDIPALNDALVTLSSNALSATEKDNVQIMKARSLYEAGVLKPLEDHYITQGSDDSISNEAIKSIELFRDALYVKQKKPPVFPDRHPYITYRVAFIQLEKGQIPEALQSLTKAGLALDHPLISYIKGLQALQASRFQEANDLFTAALGIEDLDVEVRFRLIEAAFGSEHYVDVIKRIQDFKDQYPQSESYSKWLLLYESLSYVHQGQVNKVQKDLEKLAPTFPILNYYLGQEAMLGGQDKAAVDYLQKAALFFNDSPINQTRVLYALAWAEFRAGQFVAAKEHFVQFLKRTENDETKRITALIKIGDASYNTHSYKDAAKEYGVVLSELEKKKDIYPELFARVLLNQARILGKLHQTDSAVSLLDRYVLISAATTDKIEALKMKAAIYTQENILEKADQALSKMIETYGVVDEDILMSLADNRFNLNQFEGALQTYQQYLTLYPKGDRRMDARYGEVQSLMHLKRYPEAQIQAGYTDGEFGTQLYLEIEKTIELIKQQESSK